MSTEVTEPAPFAVRLCQTVHPARWAKIARPMFACPECQRSARAMSDAIEQAILGAGKDVALAYQTGLEDGERNLALDLQVRLKAAADTLRDDWAHLSAEDPSRRRMEYKRQGVTLALSYVEEALR